MRGIFRRFVDLVNAGLAAIGFIRLCKNFFSVLGSTLSKCLFVAAHLFIFAQDHIGCFLGDIAQRRDFLRQGPQGFLREMVADSRSSGISEQNEQNRCLSHSIQFGLGGWAHLDLGPTNPVLNETASVLRRGLHAIRNLLFQHGALLQSQPLIQF